MRVWISNPGREISHIGYSYGSFSSFCLILISLFYIFHNPYLSVIICGGETIESARNRVAEEINCRNSFLLKIQIQISKAH